MEVINILKRCSNKKTERVMKASAFLVTAIWSQLAHSWYGLEYMCKAKYRTLWNR